MEQVWRWVPAPPNLTLESLFDKKKKFCFLVGSGVSFDSPSNVPTGMRFTKQLIKQLIPEPLRTTLLSLTDPERMSTQSNGDFLRFEHLMEELSSWADPNLHVLDIFAESKLPNFNHMFLAEMLFQGHHVFTTNFDNLIEYALLATGIPLPQIQPVIFMSDWETQPSSNNYPVYKLHGSLMDIRTGKDCRESLQRTLTRITEKNNEFFPLESQKRLVLQSVLRESDLIIIGYSGLNDFDILPTLQSISSNKRVFWVTHDPNKRSIDQMEIHLLQPFTRPREPISIDQDGSDYVKSSLFKFLYAKTRLAENILHLTIHTGTLLEWFWRRYSTRPRPSLSSDSSSLMMKERFIQPLVLSDAEQWVLAGKIFADHKLLEYSFSCYETALGLATKTQDIRLKSVCLNNLGLLLSGQGRINEALEYYNHALALNEQIGNIKDKSANLSNIGILLESMGRLTEALKYQLEAIAVDEQLGNTQGKGKKLYSIGLLLERQNHLIEALNYCQHALTVLQRLNDTDIIKTIQTTISTLQNKILRQNTSLSTKIK